MALSARHNQQRNRERNRGSDPEQAEEEVIYVGLSAAAV
jgi:hypothetical protein